MQAFPSARHITGSKEILQLQIHPLAAPQASSGTTVHIGQLTGDQVQIGDNNSQVQNIHIQQLVDAIAKSSDKEAKSKLRALLENKTVAIVIGAGVSGLIKSLAG